MQLSLDDPDTLLVWLYSLIDSFFAQTELPLYTERFSNNRCPPLTDAELFTTALFPILMGYTDQKLGHRYLRRHYRSWFRALPVYEVWNRRLNREPEALHYVYNLILRYLAPLYRIQEFVIDTLPVVVCQAQHSAHARAAQPFVTKGYCQAKKKYYLGAKIELLAGFQDDGLPVPGGYIVATARDHDLTIAKETMPDLPGIKIFGDKADVDQKFQLDLFNQYIDLVVPIKKKKNGPPLGLFDQAYNSLLSSKRQPIESLVAWINNKNSH